MIKAKVTTADTDHGLRAIAAEFAKLKGAYVSIGVHEDAGSYPAKGGSEGPTIAEVAWWNEFGTERIPSRSFLRNTVDANRGYIDKLREAKLEQMKAGQITAIQVLSAIGFNVREMVKKAILSNMPPANAPATVKYKEREAINPIQTLVATHTLFRAIEFEVVGG